MSRFTSVFCQLLQLFSRLDLQRAAKATNAERHARGFTCWGQFVAMLFCQLGRAKSLREICGGLAACEGKLSHLGITAPERATMAYANEHRPWQLYKAVFFQLLGRCQAVAPGRLLRNIFASVAEYERELIRERVKAGLAGPGLEGDAWAVRLELSTLPR